MIHLIEESQNLKLYLLQEIGPTKFNFKDDAGKKFKVEVGSSIRCSCKNVINDHCIHTFYVLQKIFKVGKDNPLLWQKEYSDSEISDLIKMRHAITNTGSAAGKKKFLSRQKMHATQLHDASQPNLNSNTKFRVLMEEDSICPICHESLFPEIEAITFCQRQCGNNFHIKCLTVWIDHKIQEKKPVTCPCCRSDWGPAIQNEMRDLLQRFEDQFVLHKHACCAGCNKKQIRGAIFHCLFCDNTDLCGHCYHSEFQHMEHNKFIYKLRVADQWKPAPERQCIQQFKGNGQLFQNLKNYQRLRPQDLVNEINKHQQQQFNFQTGNQINQATSNQSSQIIEDCDILVNHLMDCFPNLKSFHELNSFNCGQGGGMGGGLAIVGNDVMKNKEVCILCHEQRTSEQLKRLYCGHCMDSQCLKEFFQEQNVLVHQLRCPLDQQIILKGFHSVLKKNFQPQIMNSIQQNDQIKSATGITQISKYRLKKELVSLEQQINQKVSLEITNANPFLQQKQSLPPFKSNQSKSQTMNFINKTKKNQKNTVNQIGLQNMALQINQIRKLQMPPLLTPLDQDVNDVHNNDELRSITQDPTSNVNVSHENEQQQKNKFIIKNRNGRKTTISSLKQKRNRSAANHPLAELDVQAFSVIQPVCISLGKKEIVQNAQTQIIKKKGNFPPIPHSALNSNKNAQLEQDNLHLL